MKKLFKHFNLLGFDRSFSKGFGSQLIWLASIMCIVYIVLTGISYIGEMYTGEDVENNRLLDILLVLIDPGSGSESMSSPLIIICAILGLIIFSGMLISVISNVLERRVESYNNGETDYNISDHVVILGFNNSIPSLLKEIHKTHQGYILLMCEKETSKVRDWIHAHLDGNNKDDKEIEKKLIVLNGVRNADDDIDRLNLSNNVQEIYIIGEENEIAHDAISMECAKNIASKVSNENEIKCHLQLDSDTMFAICQKIDLNYGGKMRILPFSFNEIWAHKALAVMPTDGRPLDGEGITKGSDKHVHFIIIGMNPLSWSLAVNAAHILHFPNFVEGNFETYSKITFIDKDAFEKGKKFRSRYNHLFNVARWREINDNQCTDSDKYWIDPLGDSDSTSPFKHLGPTNFMDIQWEFIEGDVYSKNIMDYLETSSINKQAITSIALCQENSDENISICLSLPERTKQESNEILVRQDESNLLIDDLLRKAKGFEKIRAFGMMNECYKENLNSDKYGKIINACYIEGGCKFDDSKEDNEKIDSAWNSPDCYPIDKCSSNYCANMLFVKLRFLGLDTTKILTQQEIQAATSKVNHDIIQRTEHNRWNTERLLLGMRPLYREELDEWRNNWVNKTKEERKEERKRQKLILKHVDICSNSQLANYDEEMLSIDTSINNSLYKLYDYFINKK